MAIIHICVEIAAGEECLEALGEARVGEGVQAGNAQRNLVPIQGRLARWRVRVLEGGGGLRGGASGRLQAFENLWCPFAHAQGDDGTCLANHRLQLGGQLLVPNERHMTCATIRPGLEGAAPLPGKSTVAELRINAAGTLCSARGKSLRGRR